MTCWQCGTEIELNELYGERSDMTLWLHTRPEYAYVDHGKHPAAPNSPFALAKTDGR